MTTIQQLPNPAEPADLARCREELTDEISRHEEDAAMWMSPDSTSRALLTLPQRVSLAREHLDHIERLSAIRDRVEFLLSQQYSLPPQTRSRT